MKLAARVHSFAALEKEGILSRKGLIPWEKDQKGLEEIRRPQVLSSPYPSFGKLCLPDKLLFSVVSVLLDGINGSGGEKSGICLGLPFGSISTDIAYMNSVRNGFPSPAIFSATLPSSAIADAAIFYGYKGPNRIFAGGDSTGFSAIDEALWCIKSGKADTMIAADVRALEDAGVVTGKMPGGSPGNYAYALLLRLDSPGDNAPRLTWETSSDLPPDSKPDHELFLRLIRHLVRNEAALIQVGCPGFKGRLELAV